MLQTLVMESCQRSVKNMSSACLFYEIQLIAFSW